MLSDAQLSTLARLAADTVVLSLRWSAAEPAPIAPTDREFEARGASYVTLRQGDRMRGCMGSVVRRSGLYEDVVENARRAALRDPRFEPLTIAELGHTDLEVAVLTAASRLHVRDEDDLHRRLRPGIDGLVLRHGDQTGVFLPEVWDAYPTPERFVAELYRKARVAPDVPATRLDLRRFVVQRSARISLDREVARRDDVQAKWWRVRARVRARSRAKRLLGRQAAHAGER